MTDVSGASSISQCACVDGFIATVVNGSRSCHCEAGYGLARTGSAERCSACIPGAFKPTRGNDRCTDCPSDRTTVREGAISLSACVCKLGLFDHNGTCRSCPELGADCSAVGVKVETLPVMEGYWRAATTTDVLHPCYTRAFCPNSNASANASATCAEGHTGPFCEICESGYYRSTIGGCVICQGSLSTGFMSFGVMMAAILILTVCGVWQTRRWQLTGMRRKLAELAEMAMVDGGDAGIEAAIDETIESVDNKIDSAVNGRAASAAVPPSLPSLPSPPLSPPGGNVRRTRLATSATAPAADERVSRKTGTTATAMKRFGAMTRQGKRMVSGGIFVKLKILISLFQVLNGIGSVFELRFPPIFAQFLRFTLCLEFNLPAVLPLSCWLPMNFHHTLVVQTVWPLAVVLILLALHFILKAMGRKQEHRRETAKKRVIRASIRGERISQSDAEALTESVAIRWSSYCANFPILIMFLVYTSNVARIFSAFLCIPLPEVGERYLRADLSIDCDSEAHQSMQWTYALPMAIIYPFGVPLFLLAALRYYHKRLSFWCDKEDRTLTLTLDPSPSPSPSLI